LFVDPSSGSLSFDLHGTAKGGPVEPACQRAQFAERRRLEGQRQESRLERVLGILVVLKQVSAHAPDQPAMPSHQLCKRRLLVPICEPFQQLAIREVLARPRSRQLANLSEHNPEWCAGHGLDFPKALSLLYSCLWRAKWYDFSGKRRHGPAKIDRQRGPTQQEMKASTPLSEVYRAFEHQWHGIS
jgi:hypothetical protein